MPRRRAAVGLSLTVATIAASALVALAAAVDKTVTARSGTVVATLTYRYDAKSAAFPWSMLHLRIMRGGRTALDEPVTALLCRNECAVLGGSPPLTISDIERTGSSDVILDLYSGGAHCCFITQVYRYDAAARIYTRTQHDFGDPGATLETLRGQPVFRSADDRFAYQFAAFAFSGLPLQIWRFASSGFVDVTREFPALIAKDAARQYGAFLANRKMGFGVGFIAAWAADEDLLGKQTLVAQTLAGANARGWLHGAGAAGPQGSAFIAALQRFLVKTGYTH